MATANGTTTSASSRAGSSETTGSPNAEVKEKWIVGNPEEDLDAEDELLDDEDTEEEAEEVTGQEAPPESAYWKRLDTVLSEVGIAGTEERESYLKNLEELASNPERANPATPIEDEVVRRLSADPDYVEAYQLLQAGDAAGLTQAEKLSVRSSMRSAYQLTQQQVFIERQQEEQSRLSRGQRERDQIDRVAGSSEFSSYLRDPTQQRSLLAYARKHGLQDMEVAARAYFFEANFDRGRNTQERGRRGAVQTGASTRNASAPKTVPSEVIDQGMEATRRYQMNNGMIPKRKR